MKLGFAVSEITVSRYMPRRPSDLDQLKRWVTFLNNHKDAIAAMDLFTVPTAPLKGLYGFFVTDHDRCDLGCWVRTRPIQDPEHPGLPLRPRLWHYRVLVDFITATSGARPPRTGPVCQSLADGK